MDGNGPASVKNCYQLAPWAQTKCSNEAFAPYLAATIEWTIDIWGMCKLLTSGEHWRASATRFICAGFSHEDSKAQ